MKDRYGRTINYLRISVTDRCNLRCVYCRPATGPGFSKREDVLSLEELAEVARVAVTELGIPKVRLTGGEPLMRRGIVELTRLLGAIPGLQDLAMTTNGILLPRYAAALKEAGLQRVNVSLDTLDPERFAAITRGGRVDRVLAGLEAARAAGLAPIRINCVVKHDAREPDAVAVREFAKANGFEPRFIREMNMATGEFWVVDGGSGGDCKRCGRLRLTSTGDVLPCLFSDLRFNVRELGVKEALVQAIEHKPVSGHHSDNNRFYTVGG